MTFAGRTNIGSFWGIGEESTFGTGVSAANWFYMRPGDDGLTSVRERIEPSDLAEGGHLIANVSKGNRVFSGTMGMDLQWGGGWGMLLDHLLYAHAVTAGVGPYTHTWTARSAPSGIAGTGISLWVYRDGELGSSDNAWRYHGVRPKGVEFTFEPGARVRAEWDLMVQGYSMQTKPTPSYASDAWIKFPSDRTSPTSAIQYGADAAETAYACRRMSLKIALPESEIRDLPDPDIKEPTVGDDIMITGSCEVLYPGASTTGGAFFQDHINQTARSMIMSCEGPTTSEALTFDMGNVLITNDQDPRAQDPGAKWQTVEWRAYRTAALKELVAILTNSDSSLFT